MEADLVAEFERRFIKGGERIILPDLSVSAFRKDNSIFVLSVQKGGGVITNEQQKRLISFLHVGKAEKIFVTLFDDMNDFKAYSDNLSWGSYAWIMSEPNHTIHFDDKPTLHPRRPAQL